MNNWEKCPVCEGQGSVAKPSWIPPGVQNWASTAVSHTCHVCKGAGIISSVTGLPPAYAGISKPEEVSLDTDNDIDFPRESSLQ